MSKNSTTHEGTRSEIEAQIAELRERAARSQAEAHKLLNPLFEEHDDRRPPRDFVESSYLFIRSCDADIGTRPFPCSVFWVSPDLRVAPLSNLGTATSQLTAGDTYRLTATVRNRGDLMVPAAKVEFYLVNPTLGFDTRYATKLGVAADRVQAYGATEISLDYRVPPTLSGHRCLFARVFSFSPLDLPVDDFTLDPRIDRHVGQLNLNIVAQATSFSFDWVHHLNAVERLEIVPMSAAMVRAVRHEAVTALALEDGARWKEFAGKLAFKVMPGEGAEVEIEHVGGGIQLVSTNREAVPLERQAALVAEVQEALAALEGAGSDARQYRKLFREYRAMTAQSMRTRVSLDVPDLGLEPGHALALNVVRRRVADDEALGGIGLLASSPKT
jgi:hypothetical protein